MKQPTRLFEGSAMSTETAMLRTELLMPKSRYACYAFSPAIYAVVRNLEIEIPWIEHGRDARSPRYPTLLASSRRVSSTA